MKYACGYHLSVITWISQDAAQKQLYIYRRKFTIWPMLLWDDPAVNKIKILLDLALKKQCA